MSASQWIRQSHRWVSMAFTLGVIVNMVVMTRQEKPPVWVGMLALVPLIVLLLSGLSMFALPYFRQWRERAPRVGGESAPT